MSQDAESSQAAREAAVEQIHQVLVEMKDFLEEAATRKGQRLLGKVELVLNNWDDDALFASDVDLDEDLEDGGEFFPEDDDYDDYDD